MLSFSKTFNGLFSNARNVGVSSIILTVSDLIIPTVAKLEPFFLKAHSITSPSSPFSKILQIKKKFLAEIMYPSRTICVVTNRNGYSKQLIVTTARKEVVSKIHFLC